MRRQFDKDGFKARGAYNNKSLRASAGDVKALYKKLNRLLGKENQCLPNSSNCQKVAEDFKSFFAKKVNDIRNSINEENELASDQSSECTSDINKDNLNVFEDFQIPSLEDIKDYIKALPNKFCSLDPIPTFLLKDCAEILSPIIHHIVSESLICSSFGTCLLKRAIVKPTIKKEKLDADCLKNYRPVSNLPVISKLLERVVLDQLSEHLEKNNLHATEQSGYRKNHSCETLLVKMMDDILGDIDSGKIVVVVLLDLSAAFDTIDHEILLNRLKTDFGFSRKVLRWFKSYLTGRSFSVKVGHALSSFLELLFGVPQGSLLGPILFILYVKHLEQIARRHGLTIKLYADDSQLYISFHPKSPSEYHDVVAKINTCLEEIRSWMVLNFMKLNDSKTELLIIGKPLVLKSNEFGVVVCLGDEVIEPTECKDDKWTSLGIKFDESLSMERQINCVKQKCSWTMGNMRTIRGYLDFGVKIMMVKQLVILRVDFCNALYINLPKRLIKKLASILNNGIRFIFDIKDYKEDLIPYYKEAHILPIVHRINFKVCLLCYKALNSMAPSYFKDLLQPEIYASERPSTRLRPSDDTLRLKVPPLSKTKLGIRRFSYYAPNTWNDIPFYIRSSPNVEQFKKLLKTHLFSSLM